MPSWKLSAIVKDGRHDSYSKEFWRIEISAQPTRMYVSLEVGGMHQAVDPQPEGFTSVMETGPGHASLDLAFTESA